MTPQQLIKRNEKRVYYFVSRNTCKREKVFCDYITYLFLKLCYGVGLTDKQYKAYKAIV